MAVGLNLDGKVPEIGVASKLFTVPVGAGFGNPYDPSSGGERFLVISRPLHGQESAASALTVVVNWRSIVDGMR